MAVIGFGFVFSTLAAYFFWNTLQRPVSSNYNLAVILNLWLLSSLFALVFGLSIAVQVIRWLYRKRPQVHWPSRYSRLPRSAFGQHWSERENATYERNRRHMLETGEQAAFRLDPVPPEHPK
jgi:hypothetical protein